MVIKALKSLKAVANHLLPVAQVAYLVAKGSLVVVITMLIVKLAVIAFGGL